MYENDRSLHRINGRFCRLFRPLSSDHCPGIFSVYSF
jgi:hypothetical protein